MSPPVALLESLLPLQHHADVLVDDVLRLAFGFDASVQEKDRPVRKLLHQTEVVRNEKDRGFLLAQFLELANAPVRKNRIAHRKRFVDDQNVRIDMYGGGEREPDVHAARILFDGPVDEVADLREGLDQRQVPLHFGAADPHDLAVDENVLAAGEFRD